MFGGHVSAQDGKSDLEQPSLITPIVLFMEISKDGSDCGLVSRSVALLQEARLTHATIYVHVYLLA